MALRDVQHQVKIQHHVFGYVESHLCLPSEVGVDRVD